ncbi:TIGR03118 family protein [Occallatibacter riparius]|uniref:TIGR03118 family protein n=1 Tax=Occallatibacter riparius TaxID=1002689 RepID=A0A9J7BUY2_9BACT|nr:TIGR03118 family protein [Occallatibacter riparius]UWZ86432.1 TIGR03118 family protein [Occallatibacter riparius]
MLTLSLCPRFLAIAFSIAATLGLPALPAMAQHYMQANLSSDQSAVASHIDPHLLNPWGLARGGGSAWFVADNANGLVSIYDSLGASQPLSVSIPAGDPTQNPTGAPTGIVYNGGAGFEVATGKPARLVFATEDGTVSGWNPDVSLGKAILKVNTKSASVFKGLALATFPGTSGALTTYLYVADFRQAQVQVYDQSFHSAVLRVGQFQDPSLPVGYAPFNIQNIGGNLYVTYALQDSVKHDELAGAGNGYVNVFSSTGLLLRRLQHGSWLNAPWGLAMASGDFGLYSHDLLIAQFGSGNVAAYDPVTGNFKGLLNSTANTPITIPGLWGLSFASGTVSGSSFSLYFTAGPARETHGLFGTIRPYDPDNIFGSSN